MVQKQVINTINVEHPSKLEQFSLGFEFDKTLQEVKRETRARTLNRN
ncbi:MAG: hypothetical protein WCP11_00990 [Candidatus Saccharibacteria bacterium]